IARHSWGGAGLCGVSCGDYYRKRIPLTTTWTRWVIKFTDLAQSGQQGAAQAAPHERECLRRAPGRPGGAEKEGGVCGSDFLARASIRHLVARRPLRAVTTTRDRQPAVRP